MSDENFSEDFIRDIEEEKPETVTLNLEDDTPVAEEESFSLDDVKEEMVEQPEEVKGEKKKEVKEEIEESIPEVDDIVVDTKSEEEHEVIVDGVESNPIDNSLDDSKESEKKPKSNLLILIIIGIVLFVGLVVGGVLIYVNDKPPEIYTVHIESDNFDDHTTAKYGNKITLTFSFTENLRKPPRVVINNREVEVFGEHKEYYAKYFVSNQGMEDVLVTFTIEDYQDRLFKKGPPVITTTDNSQVTIKSIIS